MKPNETTSNSKKATKSAYDKIYHAANREKRLAYHAEWRRKNDAKIRAGRVAEREQKSQYNAAYHAAHAKELRAKGRARYAADPEKHRKRALEYAQRNPEKVAARMDRWRRENPDKITTQRRIYMQREASKKAKLLSEAARRARKCGCEVIATKEEVDSFMAAATKCLYCGTGERITLDHFMPLNLGGEHVLENFAAACRSCNSKKKDKHPEDFLIEIGLLTG